MNTEPKEPQLLDRLHKGDRAAFDALVARCLPMLRATARRIVGVREQADDIVQDALLKAWQGIDHFRRRAQISTWLNTIVARTAIDYLREQKRWRANAQVIYASECRKDPGLANEVGATLNAPDHIYDVHEHISYCFTCVARSLDHEQREAIVLRDVLGLSNDEAAKEAGVTTSVLRHRLAAARDQMTELFEGLCALVNKRGVCYQCKGLRDATPERRRGPELPRRLTLDERLAVVRKADTDSGASQKLHDLFWTRTAQIEASGIGDAEAVDCSRE